MDYQRKNVAEGHFKEGYFFLGNTNSYPFSGILYNKNKNAYLRCFSSKNKGKICYYYKTQTTFIHYKNGKTLIIYEYNNGAGAMNPDFSIEYYTYIFKNGDKFCNNQENETGEFFHKKRMTVYENVTYNQSIEIRAQDFIKERLGGYLKERRKVWYSPDYKWKSTGLSMIDKMHNLQKME